MADAAMRTRRVGRPAAAESGETRARILRAAREAFAARGYRRASNQAIAAAAGVTPNALYHYFASKADLFAAVHEASLAVLLDAYGAAAARSREPPEQLCALVEANATLNRAQPGLAELLALAPLEARRHPELAAKLGASGDRVPALLREILEAGCAAGRLPPGLVAGIGLLRRASWARILALVLAVFELAAFPIGTVLAGYTAFVLSQHSAPEVFGPCCALEESRLQSSPA